jgi:starch-binding outer membrane protein, SusD/RagB family
MISYRIRMSVTVLAALALSAAGCRDTLLQVQHPDIIDPTDLNTAAGADALRVGAIGRLAFMTAGDEASWVYGGLLVDEFKSGDTFVQRDQADQRTIDPSNSFVSTAYRDVQRTRVAAWQAIVALHTFKPNPVSNIGQMWFAKGFAEMQSASDFCNGQPLAILTTTSPTEGPPLSISDVFTMAAASFDSALANSGGDATVTNASKIGKARALLGLGDVQGAAAAVAGVATNFAYNMTYEAVKEDNFIWTINNSSRRYSVQDSIDATGTVPNGLPFVSAKDPRVPTAATAKLSFDGVTPFQAQLIWSVRDAPVAVVNGIDARLAEAEAKLAGGDIAGWLVTLNTLRAGPTPDGPLTITGMAPLTDPGTATARLKLMFRERAFWTFGRGQRLGDLRRMVRQYAFTPAQVFPGEGGTWFKTSTPYGHDYNIPVSSDELNNPNFHGCTDRNP